MPTISLGPFTRKLLRKVSPVTDAAVWCCIAPYILAPSATASFRKKLITAYSADLFMALDELPREKIGEGGQKILITSSKLFSDIQMEEELSDDDEQIKDDTLGLHKRKVRLDFRALLKAPSQNSIKALWGILGNKKRQDVRKKDYLSVYNVVFSMMKLYNIENRSELFSMESAKILAIKNP